MLKKSIYFPKAEFVWVKVPDRKLRSTWRDSQRDLILLAVVDGQNGVRGGVITEPVGAVAGRHAVDADHDVTVKQHLRRRQQAG